MSMKSRATSLEPKHHPSPPRDVAPNALHGELATGERESGANAKAHGHTTSTRRPGNREPAAQDDIGNLQSLFLGERRDSKGRQSGKVGKPNARRGCAQVAFTFTSPPSSVCDCDYACECARVKRWVLGTFNSKSLRVGCSGCGTIAANLDLGVA